MREILELELRRCSKQHDRLTFPIAFVSISMPMKHLCGYLVLFYKGAIGFCFLPMTSSVMNVLQVY
jgi:hypothetical protein